VRLHSLQTQLPDTAPQTPRLIAVAAPPRRELGRRGLVPHESVMTGSRRPNRDAMIRISISPAAFDAIASTLPGNVGFENARDTNGDWFIWLPRDVLAKLNALRGPGESYSDLILAVAEGAGA
jgi:hypothetical protein